MNAGLQRRLRLVVFDLKLLEAVLDLLAAGPLRAAAYPGGRWLPSRGARRRRWRALADSSKQISNVPIATGDVDGESSYLHCVRALPWVSATFAASRAAASRFSSRSSALGPRSSAGRCRLIGACRPGSPSRLRRRYRNERSWVMITSPSRPSTSVICVILREPSRRRIAWTITSTEETSISRMVFEGSQYPPS